MLSPTSPAMRLGKAARVLKQSNQFISPHWALQQRLKKIRTTRPNSCPSLVKVLSTYSNLGDASSPFLPTKYRSGHSSPHIDPAKVRWRAPIFKAQARAQLCKQAFHWRILRHIFHLSPASIPPVDSTDAKVDLPRSTRLLLDLQPNFYDGSLTIEEFQKIPSDPVPTLVALFGGQDRMSVKDKRLLGLLEPPKDFIKPRGSTSSSSAADLARDPIRTPPRYLVPSVTPQFFGPYLGRRNAFKGKRRQRNRESKIEEVVQKMAKMDDRIKTYRKEWKIIKEKAKPALPY